MKRFFNALCLVIVVAGYALLLWRGPWLLDAGHVRTRNLQPADGVVITGARTALVALGAGIVAGIGLFYTHRNHNLSQEQFKNSQDQFSKQHAQTVEQFTLAQKQFQHSQEQFKETQKKDREQTELTREGQVTARYVEAIKLLGSNNLTERLGEFIHWNVLCMTAVRTTPRLWRSSRHSFAAQHRHISKIGLPLRMLRDQLIRRIRLRALPRTYKLL
ncbi:hypothetical protein N7U49_19850 [Streptomyces sp. AD2-2]|nr:hypothetical protein N7U49_19850 [Streptomyces sp. AD2-2]